MGMLAGAAEGAGGAEAAGGAAAGGGALDTSGLDATSQAGYSSLGANTTGGVGGGVGLDSSGLDPSQQAGYNTLQGGDNSTLASFLKIAKDPNVQKMLERAMGGGGGGGGIKIPQRNNAQRDFQEMAQYAQSQPAGNRRTGSPGLGSLQPSGAYVGDIPNYSIDPNIARVVLQRIGIPPGMGGY